MANTDEYKKIQEYMAQMNLSDQVRRPPEPPKVPTVSKYRTPPPPPPYSSRNVMNNASNNQIIGSNNQIMTNNGANNQMSEKPRLPYNVKLPKVNGPSEAERKLELLTRELEKEMDEKEKQEYFGMYIKSN